MAPFNIFNRPKNNDHTWSTTARRSLAQFGKQRQSQHLRQSEAEVDSPSNALPAQPATVPDAAAEHTLPSLKEIMSLAIKTGSARTAADARVGHGLPSSSLQSLADTLDPMDLASTRASRASVDSFSQLKRKLFVLTRDGAVLQYAEFGPPDRQPEKCHSLSRETLVTSTETISGKAFALEMSEPRTSLDHIRNDASLRKLQRMGIDHGSVPPEPHHTLLVLESSLEMMHWSAAIRKAVQKMQENHNLPTEATPLRLDTNALSLPPILPPLSGLPSPLRTSPADEPSHHNGRINSPQERPQPAPSVQHATTPVQSTLPSTVPEASMTFMVDEPDTTDDESEDLDDVPTVAQLYHRQVIAARHNSPTAPPNRPLHSQAARTRGRVSDPIISTSATPSDMNENDEAVASGIGALNKFGATSGATSRQPSEGGDNTASQAGAAEPAAPSLRSNTSMNSFKDSRDSGVLIGAPSVTRRDSPSHAGRIMSRDNSNLDTARTSLEDDEYHSFQQDLIAKPVVAKKDEYHTFQLALSSKPSRQNSRSLRANRNVDTSASPTSPARRKTFKSIAAPHKSPSLDGPSQRLPPRLPIRARVSSASIASTSASPSPSMPQSSIPQRTLARVPAQRSPLEQFFGEKPPGQPDSMSESVPAENDKTASQASDPSHHDRYLTPPTLGRVDGTVGHHTQQQVEQSPSTTQYFGPDSFQHVQPQQPTMQGHVPEWNAGGGHAITPAVPVQQALAHTSQISYHGFKRTNSPSAEYTHTTQDVPGTKFGDLTTGSHPVAPIERTAPAGVAATVATAEDYTVTVAITDLAKPITSTTRPISVISDSSPSLYNLPGGVPFMLPVGPKRATTEAPHKPVNASDATGSTSVDTDTTNEGSHTAGTTAVIAPEAEPKPIPSTNTLELPDEVVMGATVNGPVSIWLY